MQAYLSLLLSWLVSALRSRRALTLENLALRQQLMVYERRKLKAKPLPLDKSFWSILSLVWDGWKSVLVIAKPDTVVSWHRKGFRLFWTRKSKRKKMGRPRITKARIDLIRRISIQNPHWGVWKIHDEINQKLGIRVSFGSVQRYRIQARDPRPGLSWMGFLKAHAREALACDFLVQYTALFKAVYVFVAIEIESRKVAHFNVTDHPTLAWVQQQIREATPPETSYKYLVHDNDAIFGQLRHKGAAYRSSFDEWLEETMGIEGLHTPYGAPKANSFAERFNQTLRREALDHFIFLGESHIYRTCKRFIEYFNQARPHQGIDRIPDPDPELRVSPPPNGKVVAFPVLGGLHHDYRRVA